MSNNHQPLVWWGFIAFIYSCQGGFDFRFPPDICCTYPFLWGGCSLLPPSWDCLPPPSFSRQPSMCIHILCCHIWHASWPRIIRCTNVFRRLLAIVVQLVVGHDWFLLLPLSAHKHLFAAPETETWGLKSGDWGLGTGDWSPGKESEEAKRGSLGLVDMQAALHKNRLPSWI